MYVFGSGTAILTPIAGDPNSAGNPTPMQLATMQEVSIELSASQKELYGKGQFPVAIARTAGKLNMKAKFANINAKVLNDYFWGTTVVPGQIEVVLDELVTLTAGSGTVSHGAQFLEDLGVLDDVTGKQLTHKASAPALGEYTQTSGGVYSFNVGDVTAKRISYRYTPATPTGFKNVVSNKPMGAMPKFSCVLTNPQYGPKFVMKFYQCIAAKLTQNMKNEDFMIPEFDFSAFADGAGNLFEYDMDE
jgi:hypothetical protein